jgi:hypothetical protein
MRILNHASKEMQMHYPIFDRDDELERVIDFDNSIDELLDELLDAELEFRESLRNFIDKAAQLRMHEYVLEEDA